MSLLDQIQVASIASCGACMMKELADGFKEEFAEKSSEIQIHLGMGDQEKLKPLFHQLKGTSATFGMKVLGEKFAELEQRPVQQADYDLLTELAEASFKELYEYLDGAE